MPADEPKPHRSTTTRTKDLTLQAAFGPLPPSRAAVALVTSRWPAEEIGHTSVEARDVRSRILPATRRGTGWDHTLAAL